MMPKLEERGSVEARTNVGSSNQKSRTWVSRIRLENVGLMGLFCVTHLSINKVV